MMPDWKDILEQAGYPTDMLCLDFETYFDSKYSLANMSTIEYIMDPRFEFTGLGAGFGSDTLVLFLAPDEIANYIKAVDWDNITVLVQNARFDITILQTKFGIVPKYIIDLKDIASHYDARMSHRLKDMAKKFSLKPKGETMQFKGLHWADMSEEQRSALAEYTIHDVELETELAKILLLKLTNPKFELQLARHTLDLWLHRRFTVDLDLATKLRVQMRNRIASAIQASGYTPKQLRSAKFADYLGDVLPDGEEIPMKQGKRGNIPALAKSDEACQQLQAHPKQEVRDLITARLAAKSWPTHIKRVSSIIAQAKANDGLLRIPLTYYGGHLGRWGGSEKINLQNLGGKGRSGSENDPLIREVRQLFCASPDYILGICDSAQIECRVLAWLAGQQDLLDGFTKGEDIYSQFATTLFGCPVRKPKKTDPRSLATMLEIRRGFGKDAILGCIAKGSLVLTDRGSIPIEQVTLFDKVWDGSNFVQHWGVVNRGNKVCIEVGSIWLTPEHEILTREGWTTAAELSTHNPSQEWFTENLQWFKSQKESVGESSPSNVVARVVEKLLRQEIIWSPVNLHAVMSVLKEHPAKLRAIAQTRKNHISQDCLIEFVQSLADAKSDRIQDMAVEVLKCGPVGSTIELLFLNIWRHYQVGITQVLKLIESITIEDMNLTISGLLQEKRIVLILADEINVSESLLAVSGAVKNLEEINHCKDFVVGIVQAVLPTYDILNAGPAHRFQVGSLIASNCGYGMGTEKFYNNCLSNPSLRPLFDSGQYDYKFVDKLIKAYRTTYSTIPTYWKNVERAFKQCVRFPHLEPQVGQVKFRCRGSEVQIELPSNRILYYPHCRVDKKNHIKWQHGMLWGGSITENIDQACSRDLLGFWMLACEESGLPVTLHVHDEIVTMLPEDQAKEGLAQLESIMCTLPDWAEGLPVAAEGKLCKRYEK